MSAHIICDNLFHRNKLLQLQKCSSKHSSNYKGIEWADVLKKTPSFDIQYGKSYPSLKYYILYDLKCYIQGDTEKLFTNLQRCQKHKSTHQKDI